MNVIALIMFSFMIGLYIGQWTTRFFDRRNAKIAQYTEAIDRGFDPVECRDRHLPGDCPLCGAI